MTSTAAVCRVCTVQFSKYTCPRCNSPYCSLPCYQKHSGECTEAFYEENMAKHLTGMVADNDQRNSMLEILQRTYQGDGGDLGDVVSDNAHTPDTSQESGDETEEQMMLSEATLEKILLKADQGESDDAALSPEDLTPAELAAFEALVLGGGAQHLVQVWKPWWESGDARHITLSAQGTALIEDPQGADPTPQVGEMSERAVPPPPSAPLPPLSSLVAAAPSPAVQWHLLDVLYTYCYLMRSHNGEPQLDLLHACLTVKSLSTVLEATPLSTPATSAQAVLCDCMQRLCQPPLGHIKQSGMAAALLDDVAAVVGLGRGAGLCLLNHLRDVLEAGLQELRSARASGGPDVEVDSRWLKAASRKLTFLMAWANEVDESVYPRLQSATLASKPAKPPETDGPSSVLL